MTIQQNYNQKYELISFVNSIAELVLNSEEFTNPNTDEIQMLGIEEDGNIFDPECSSDIEDIKAYLNTVFSEIKRKLK